MRLIDIEKAHEGTQCLATRMWSVALVETICDLAQCRVKKSVACLYMCGGQPRRNIDSNLRALSGGCVPFCWVLFTLHQSGDLE